jgi:hypothetical protein
MNGGFCSAPPEYRKHTKATEEIKAVKVFPSIETRHTRERLLWNSISVHTSDMFYSSTLIFVILMHRLNSSTDMLYVDEWEGEVKSREERGTRREKRRK